MPAPSATTIVSSSPPLLLIAVAALLLVPAAQPVSNDGHAPFPPDPPRGRNDGGIDYGVVVDAGSSGSRARVYAWPRQTDPLVVPNITQIYSYKKEPGISDLADDLDQLEPYMISLVSAAAAHVPATQHSDTVIYCMATAGMRLLLEDKANAVMDQINAVLLKPDINPFNYDPLNTRILSGEEEGVFAWISVNYLSGFFNKKPPNQDERSTGLLEMGGASVQLAFQPDGSILADKFPVKVGGTIYPVYVHSFLYYGQNYADLWVKQYLYDERDIKDNIPNPCMLKDDILTESIQGVNVTYFGIGNPTDCANILDILVYKVDSRRCHPKPCSIGPVYQPSLPDKQNFYAIGAFIFPLRLLDVLQPDGTFSLLETNSSAFEYCIKDLGTVRNETGRTDDFLSVECLTGLYIPILFTKAYGFSYNTSSIRAVDDIHGHPTEWPLGAIIYENERKDWQCPTSSSTAASSAPSLFVVLALLIVAYTRNVTSWRLDS